MTSISWPQSSQVTFAINTIGRVSRWDQVVVLAQSPQYWHNSFGVTGGVSFGLELRSDAPRYGGGSWWLVPCLMQYVGEWPNVCCGGTALTCWADFWKECGYWWQSLAWTNYETEPSNIFNWKCCPASRDLSGFSADAHSLCPKKNVKT